MELTGYLRIWMLTIEEPSGLLYEKIKMDLKFIPLLAIVEGLKEQPSIEVKEALLGLKLWNSPKDINLSVKHYLETRNHCRFPFQPLDPHNNLWHIYINNDTLYPKDVLLTMSSYNATGLGSF